MLEAGVGGSLGYQRVSEPIIILGTSARAAAQSAARAGYSPWAADLFADADLARLCPVHRIDRYPCDLFAAARLAPPGAWMYTGGLENYPRLVERIAAVRRLYGNAGPPLRAVRDPARLAEFSRAVGLSTPRIANRGDGLPRDGSWLRKGLRSSGGLRVESWTAENPALAEVRGWYFQERIEGQPCAAVFVAAGRVAKLLGITRQWIGGDKELGSASGAPPFHYAGSLGPLELTAGASQQLQAFGSALADSLGLVGLFGVDFILSGDVRVWPIEVNPRYPASVEILERVLGISAVDIHVSACRDGVLPDAIPLARAQRIAGKVILYAPRAMLLREVVRLRIEAESRAAEFPTIADIPAAAGDVAAGQPIVTLLADGTNGEEVTQQLERRLRELQRELESE
jgi:predicted ATP-grasp superfamily ATP-dependent carboligase